MNHVPNPDGISYCSQMLRTGTCNRKRCNLDHNVVKCDACVIHVGFERWRPHTYGKRHKDALRQKNLQRVFPTQLRPPTSAAEDAGTEQETTGPQVPYRIFEPYVSPASGSESRPNDTRNGNGRRNINAQPARRDEVPPTGTPNASAPPNYRCIVCNVPFASNRQLKAHKSTPAHRDAQLRSATERVSPSAKGPTSTPTTNTADPTQEHRNGQATSSSQSGSLWCSLCDVYFSNVTEKDLHKSSPSHKQKFQSTLNDPLQQTVPTFEGYLRRETIRCDLCQEDVIEELFEAHREDPRHQRREKELDPDDHRLADLFSDKYGIKVSRIGAGVNFGMVEMEETPTTSSSLVRVVTIMCTDKKSVIVLKKVLFSSYMPGDHSEKSFSVSFVNTTAPKNIVISSEFPRDMQVKLAPTHEGLHRVLMQFEFENQSTGKKFVIGRNLEAVVGSKAHQQLLQPSAKYEPPSLDPLPSLDEIHSLRPKRAGDQFVASEELINVAFTTIHPEEKLVELGYLPQHFNYITHSRLYQTLLHIEEEHTSRDLDRFSIPKAIICPDGRHYRLEIEGLAEKRPSLLVGDTVLFQEYEYYDSKWIEGKVHRVFSTAVLLQFPPSFVAFKGQAFRVRFVLGRWPFICCHKALATNMFQVGRVLVPIKVSKQDKLPPPRAIGLVYKNRLISGNERQKEAVERIVAQKPRGFPIVIWGPPGTGKTVTIVEAIRQLLDSDPNHRILACAPSNSAADLIAQRLKPVGARFLFRLCSASRSPDTLPRDLQDFTLLKDDDGREVFANLPIQELKAKRVVVSTCISSAMLNKLPMGHFTHIFIDEAGQAHEPEALVPVKMLSNDNTNVILSGDHKQLQPILRSHLAEGLGLKVSYLERLMKHSNEDENSGVTVIKLLDHYRCHPDIIEHPNHAFYSGELKCRSDPVITQSMLRFNYLPNSNSPLIFHAITGEDSREGQSPSFFNVAEATKVLYYVKELLGDRRLCLKPDDIGIITPYYGQVKKIRQLLKGDASKIKVGTVEEYQGQERRVIIISCVRSSVKYVDFDMTYNLGFVADPRRFNVAITRAQALLIVVGDPVVLSMEKGTSRLPYESPWFAFLSYVAKKGGWVGKQIDWNPRTRTAPRQRKQEGHSFLFSLIEKTSKLNKADNRNPQPGYNGNDDYSERPFRDAY